MTRHPKSHIEKVHFPSSLIQQRACPETRLQACATWRFISNSPYFGELTVAVIQPGPRHSVAHIQPRFPYKILPQVSTSAPSLSYLHSEAVRGEDRVNKFSLVRASATATMGACFLTSNSFTKSIKIVPSAKPKSFTPHPKSDSALHQPKSSGCSLSIKCCNFESNSPFGDVARSFPNSDWRSFRARLVVGERASRPEVPSPSVDLDAPVDRPSPIMIGDKWAHIIHEPEKGCLLIATEKLDGAHIFERAVILLLSTGPVGPTGVILNRPSLMSIKESKSMGLDMAGAFSGRPLYFGGPIEAGLFLMRGGGGDGDGDGDDGVSKSGVFEEVMEGLYYGRKESGGCAAEMVKRGVVRVGDFKFFEGCCGWDKRQLGDEIRAGYWTVAACSPSVIGLGSVGLWEEVLGLVGPKKVW